ncbi:uncharacterized protein N7482_006559 [Penicillium canariense]|uniref:Uncharacterized protein n=1 Tax=Penicillium canariense TaxID=189055 RepID=A0A9W9HXJ5_9EURO|nr:uncharacterized protein N7482_006559 [Penicillium canariense]KAJ5159555.1 hypothetical protein N7482_006559 [Penicillium canariense]
MSSYTNFPTGKDEQISMFLAQRENMFHALMGWHNELLQNPYSRANVASQLEHFQNDFPHLSALVRVIRVSRGPVPEDERLGWETCWNDKVRCIQHYLDICIKYMRDLEKGWGTGNLAIFVSMIAVSIGRLHYEKGFDEFTTKMFQLAASMSHHEYSSGLWSVWTEMVKIVHRGCDYCLD